MAKTVWTTASGIRLVVNTHSWVRVSRNGQDIGFFSKETLRGKTIRQIAEFCDTCSDAHRQVQAKFDTFKASLPARLAEKVSFGYIGNYEMYWDDTSWRVFFNIPQEKYCQSAGGYSWAQMPQFLADWDRIESRVRTAVEKGWA